MREDGDLLHYVTDHRVPLECCPSSNVQTGAVRDISSHPLKFYFDYGLRVTINTDNRLITDTTVSEELWLAHEKLGFTLEELKVLIVQGFKSAFLPYREKSALLRRVNDALAEHTGSLPRGAVLAHEVDRDDMPDAFDPGPATDPGLDTDRI